MNKRRRAPHNKNLSRRPVEPSLTRSQNCQEKFEEVASSPRFRFIGNASVGLNAGTGSCHIPLQLLTHHYDSILFAYGASEDKKLAIPGELSLKGIHSAREFVGWYNGLPDCSDLKPALNEAEEAVIIGQGNVALDVARILLEDVQTLRKTDISATALEALSKSRIKRIHIVGRRGYMQVCPPPPSFPSPYESGLKLR